MFLQSPVSGFWSPDNGRRQTLDSRQKSQKTTNRKSHRICVLFYSYSLFFPYFFFCRYTLVCNIAHTWVWLSPARRHRS